MGPGDMRLLVNAIGILLVEAGGIRVEVGVDGPVDPRRSCRKETLQSTLILWICSRLSMQLFHGAVS